MGHPATGPISPAQMRALADAPYGKAGEVLRQHDPAWGLATPDKPLIKWSVVLTGMMEVSAFVEVEAPDEATAKRIAMGMRMHQLDWDEQGSPDDIAVASVDPA
ncbi:hypothetical protein [Devosia sp. A369]